ncbi:MAG: HIT family protein [Candidatus Moduliflexus flocculans]|nr:HIT family protein [Candidatus Moduliflexus flocculans]
MRPVRADTPVTAGACSSSCSRHCNEFSDLGAEESGSLLPFIRECREFIDARFHPLGYNIGTNIGIVAGQSVRHIHIHIIPRYNGDTPDPRGGITQLSRRTPSIRSPKVSPRSPVSQMLSALRSHLPTSPRLPPWRNSSMSALQMLF